MTKASTPLMEMGADLTRLFHFASASDCRVLPNGFIALSGEQADEFNTIVLAKGAPKTAFNEALQAVSDSKVLAQLVVEEGADDILSWASSAQLQKRAPLPLMDRYSAPVNRVDTFEIGIAAPAEFSLSSLFTAEPRSARSRERQHDGTSDVDRPPDLWIAKDNGGVVGCAIFVEAGERVGIYSLITWPAHQRRGIGRAILETGIAHYQARGAERFTLGASGMGFSLYKRIGFEVVATPHVFAVGQTS